MEKYHVDVCISNKHIVFINGNLQRPGIDYIIEHKFWKGDFIIFKNKLKTKDILYVFNVYGECSWIECDENGKLINVSYYTKWIVE